MSCNVTYGAAWLVLVLCADRRLPPDAVGFGLLSTATAVGGLLGRSWSATGPSWFGFVGSSVLLALIRRRLAHITHAGEEDLAERV